MPIYLDHLEEGGLFWDALKDVPTVLHWRPVPSVVLNPALNTTDRMLIMTMSEMYNANDRLRVKTGMYLTPERAAAAVAIERRSLMRRVEVIKSADIGMTFEKMKSRPGGPWNVVRFDKAFRDAIGGDTHFIKMPRAVLFDGYLTHKDVETYLAIKAHHYRYRHGQGYEFSMSLSQLADWLHIKERAAYNRRDSLVEHGLITMTGRDHGHEAMNYRLTPLEHLYRYVHREDEGDGYYERLVQGQSNVVALPVAGVG